MQVHIWSGPTKCKSIYGVAERNASLNTCFDLHRLAFAFDKEFRAEHKQYPMITFIFITITLIMIIMIKISITMIIVVIIIIIIII